MSYVGLETWYILMSLFSQAGLTRRLMTLFFTLKPLHLQTLPIIIQGQVNPMGTYSKPSHLQKDQFLTSLRYCSESSQSFIQE